MANFTTDEQLDSWFAYHAPVTPEVAAAHERVRAECRALAATFQELLPDGPDKTVALYTVRMAMWAGNAAIACSRL